MNTTLMHRGLRAAVLLCCALLGHSTGRTEERRGVQVKVEELP